MLSDPLVIDFRNNLLSQLRTFVDSSVQLPDGVSAEDLLNLDVAEITLTVLKPVGGNLPVGLSVNAAESAETISSLVQESIDASVKQSWARSSIEHAETSITVLTRETDSADGSSNNVRAVVFQDGYVVVSNSVDAVKQVLDCWNGSIQGAFAANPTLGPVQRVTMKPGREPALF